MRKGQNPAKMGIPAYRPERLGILLLTYIPMQSGYFVDSLKVLKYQIASIHKNTSADFNLHVFDNGSCQEVRNALHKLQANGWIDWLTLSKHNIGKSGVLNWALRGMPNEIICYSDGDVYFRPNWYEASLKLLETFPQVGMVTAQPCFFDSLGGKGCVHHASRERQDLQFSTRLADVSMVEEYVRSIGNNPDLLAKYYQHSWNIAHEKSTGMEAVIGASPFQFLGYKAILEKILPLPNAHGLNKDDDAQITIRMDKIGFLQLSTLVSYAYHMGNLIEEATLREVDRDNTGNLLQEDLVEHVLPIQKHIKKAKQRIFEALDFLARLPIFKKLWQRIYNLFFEYYAKTN